MIYKLCISYKLHLNQLVSVDIKMFDLIYYNYNLSYELSFIYKIKSFFSLPND